MGSQGGFYKMPAALGGSGGGKPRSVYDNVTIGIMVLVCIGFLWEAYWLKRNQKVTFSEVFRRINFQSGGLIVWMALAFFMHSTVAWPIEWHSREAYEKKYGSPPDIEQNDGN